MKLTNTKSVGSAFLILLIFLNSISFLDITVFEKFQKIALYLNILGLILIVIARKKIYKSEVKTYIFLIVYIIYGLFTLFSTNGGFGSVVIVVYSLFLLSFFYHCTIDNKKIKILLVTFITINLYMVINSPNYYSKFMQNTDQYINSNTISMVLMYTAIYINIFLKKLNIRFYKIMSFLICILTAWAIINLQSRGALITLLAFIFFEYILPKDFWKNKYNILTTFSLIILFGTIFPIIYSKMYMNGIEFKIPFVSKSLYSGREEIWINFFNEINNNPIYLLFGLGSSADLWGEGNLNVHNNYLAIIVNFGIIGYLLYYGFIILFISKVYNKRNSDNFFYTLFIGFMCVFIYGFFENSTLWHVMFFYNFMFMALVNNNHNDYVNVHYSTSNKMRKILKNHKSELTNPILK